MSEVCPICNHILHQAPQMIKPDVKDYSCINCGNYSLSGTAEFMEQTHLSQYPHKAGVLSHHIRKAQRKDLSPFFISSDILERILEEEYPSPKHQADNMILWMGENQKAPSETMDISPQTHQAIIGANDRFGVAFILDHLYKNKYLETDQIVPGNSVSPTGLRATLSFKGWQRYEDLKKGISATNLAFMAMEFGDVALDMMFENYFKEAVAQTGFDLQRVIDKPRAGLIDDRIKVDIRTSRFLIADLTHGNKGAYWEAGYAEGLGKPVIYTCEKTVWMKEKTHFDTNHYHTVVWEKKNPNEATENLKATIRATFPTDAKLADE
jgi:hypothetical protein